MAVVCQPLFSLGRMVATPGALQALVEAGEEPLLYLSRHVRGDWGELTPGDRKENERAVLTGARIFSSYKTAAGTKIWVITEADRSSTCLLLPEEY